MKEVNLRGQHSWKLRTNSNRVQMAIKMNSNYDRRILVKAYEGDRKRGYECSPGRTITTKPAAVLHSSTTKAGATPNNLNLTFTTFSPGDHKKQRLLNGILRKKEQSLEGKKLMLLSPLSIKSPLNRTRLQPVVAAKPSLFNDDQSSLNISNFNFVPSTPLRDSKTSTY